ncbi:MAG: leucine-rich repeat domain-containing protein [Prevotella histicola]|uniref:leucine-rich repeat domain-containing protein n=1 Tax=Prevotella histicola TaxID=470565 RepID=UPI0036201110
MKQIYILLIALLMGLSANAKRAGTCGPDLRWYLTDNGVLTISGKGKMNDYSFDNRSPWYKYDIKRIIIGDGVTTIGEFAFTNCSTLTSVTIPNSVTEIGDRAFSGCINITQISSEAVVPPICGPNVFADTNKSKCKLIVPKNSLDAYKQADQWKDFL